MSKVIISLTSFPERMDIIHISINSLLNQTVKADKVILWLAPEQFPDKKLPDSILQLQDKGLEIDWYHDIKSYKKLIPALLKYPDDIIITADDDIKYRETWLEQLLIAYNENPEYIHAYRCVKMYVIDNNLTPYGSARLIKTKTEPSFTNSPTTGGGVLFPPHCFDNDVFNEETFTKLAPWSDDLWFWVMAIKNNTKTNSIVSEHSQVIDTNAKSKGFKLWRINSKPDGADKTLKILFNHYNGLLDKIKSKSSSADFWETRYLRGGNSGPGSYNRLAEFKADVLNNFCNKHNIQSVIEFGAGDGNNLSLYKIKDYVGFDVSRTILDKLKNKFKDDKTKKFFHIDQFKDQKRELSISFDVIFHLIEDDVFNEYMERLFNSSKRYVMIYSSNKDQKHTNHVLHREFTKWISEHKNDWKLKEFIKNKYPYDELKDPHNSSFSDFYIFEKINTN